MHVNVEVNVMNSRFAVNKRQTCSLQKKMSFWISFKPLNYCRLSHLGLWTSSTRPQVVSVPFSSLSPRCGCSSGTYKHIGDENSPKQSVWVRGALLPHWHITSAGAYTTCFSGWEPVWKSTEVYEYQSYKPVSGWGSLSRQSTRYL